MAQPVYTQQVVQQVAQPVYTQAVAQPVYTQAVAQPVYTQAVYAQAAPVFAQPMYAAPVMAQPVSRAGGRARVGALPPCARALLRAARLCACAHASRLALRG